MIAADCLETCAAAALLHLGALCRAQQHAAELWELLCRPYPWQHEHRTQPVAAGQRILFGEWCAYQHTVLYDNLPDLFLAFDLYDQSLNNGSGGFLSAKRCDIVSLRDIEQTIS